METPPITWTIDTKALPRASSPSLYKATPGELAALCEYLAVEEVSNFTASIKIQPNAGGKYKATGQFTASVIQASVVNLEPVDNRIEESFTIEFWPPELIPIPSEAMSVDADLPEPIEDGRIPVGRVLCELLGVSINPYPRNEGETFEWSPGEQELERGPFAQLKSLKQPKQSESN